MEQHKNTFSLQNEFSISEVSIVYGELVCSFDILGHPASSGVADFFFFFLIQTPQDQGSSHRTGYWEFHLPDTPVEPAPLPVLTVHIYHSSFLAAGSTHSATPVAFAASNFPRGPDSARSHPPVLPAGRAATHVDLSTTLSIQPLCLLPRLLL